MKKIEFKDLPDETTPIDSDNLNLMQSNIEEAIENPNKGNIIVDSIECKNLLNINFENQILNGVSFTKNEDGSITLNGTATANTAFVISKQKITGDGAYTFGVTTDISSVGHAFEVGGYVHNSSGEYLSNISTANGTKTLSNGEYMDTWFIYFLSSAVFDNLTIYPQLEKGTVSTNFVKHKDFEIVDTGWINATLLNDWANVGDNYNKVQYRRINDIVYLRGSVLKNRNISSNDDRVVFNLPSNFRPLVNMFGNHNQTPYNILVNGNVAFGDFSSYNSGDWLTFDGLYFFVD